MPIHFSNPDFLSKFEHPYPRFAQGAFKIALRALYEVWPATHRSDRAATGRAHRSGKRLARRTVASSTPAIAYSASSCVFASRSTATSSAETDPCGQRDPSCNRCNR